MTAGYTDIPSGGWKRLLPGKVVAYAELARLDRPIGIWLLLFPCFWGLALSEMAPTWLYALFAAGAFVMRAAGCTVNDIIDHRIDALVERTKHRPLPSGRIGMRGAVIFLLLLCLAGLAILLQLNHLCLELGCLSLVLVGSYPFMKRITWWPQLILGLTFNWGALMGWAAGTGHLAAPAWLLYAGGIAWTLAYDTIYAHQDKRDDMVIGVRSTALCFAGHQKAPVAAFYATALICLAAAGALAQMQPRFYAVLAAIVLFSAWTVWRWQPDNPADCLKRFKANAFVGLLVFAAIVTGGTCWAI